MTLPKIDYRIPFGANAFEILGGFRRAALKAGWSQREISDIMAEATAGSYDDLISTLQLHVK